MINANNGMVHKSGGHPSTSNQSPIPNVSPSSSFPRSTILSSNGMHPSLPQQQGDINVPKQIPPINTSSQSTPNPSTLASASNQTAYQRINQLRQKSFTPEKPAETIAPSDQILSTTTNAVGVSANQDDFISDEIMMAVALKVTILLHMKER